MTFDETIMMIISVVEDNVLMSHTIYKDHRNSSGPLKVMKMADIKRVR